MKLIREYINEAFSEDSDPIKDLNIGIARRLPEMIQNIFTIDKENKNVEQQTTFGNLREIKYNNGRLSFEFYSNTLYYINLKKVNKKQYSIKLLTKADLIEFIDLAKRVKIYPAYSHFTNDHQYSPWDYTFTIKHEYKDLFDNYAPHKSKP
jgi:hypothetical protein